MSLRESTLWDETLVDTKIKIDDAKLEKIAKQQELPSVTNRHKEAEANYHHAKAAVDRANANLPAAEKNLQNAEEDVEHAEKYCLIHKKDCNKWPKWTRWACEEINDKACKWLPDKRTIVVKARQNRNEWKQQRDDAVSNRDRAHGYFNSVTINLSNLQNELNNLQLSIEKLERDIPRLEQMIKQLLDITELISAVNEHLSEWLSKTKGVTVKVLSFSEITYSLKKIEQPLIELEIQFKDAGIETNIGMLLNIPPDTIASAEEKINQIMLKLGTKREENNGLNELPTLQQDPDATELQPCEGCPLVLMPEHRRDNTLGNNAKALRLPFFTVLIMTAVLLL